MLAWFCDRRLWLSVAAKQLQIVAVSKSPLICSPVKPVKFLASSWVLVVVRRSLSWVSCTALMPPALIPIAVAWPTVLLVSLVKSHWVGSLSLVKPPVLASVVPICRAVLLVATATPSRLIWALR